MMSDAEGPLNLNNDGFLVPENEWDRAVAKELAFRPRQQMKEEV